MFCYDYSTVMAPMSGIAASTGIQQSLETLIIFVFFFVYFKQQWETVKCCSQNLGL